MKKLIFLLIIIIILSTSVLAYQEKMTMKECIYSFNDPTFGTWNNTQNKGVFEKIDNTNLNFGINQQPNLVFTFYQPIKDYYNNFNTIREQTSIPILNFKANQDNIIYINCTFKTGNYRIFVGHYWGAISYITPTHDFNLTKGIFNKNQNKYDYYKTEYGSNYSYYYSSISNVGDFITYVNNQNSQYHDENVLYSDGLYPNTNINIISYLNITNQPTGFLQSQNQFIENGGIFMFYKDNSGYSGIRNYFYINSSLRTEDYLVPIFGDYKVRNLNTSKEIYYQSTIDESNSCGWRAPNQYLLVHSGDRIRTYYNLSNEFNIVLNNRRYSTLLSGSEFSQDGIGNIDVNVNTYRTSVETEHINIPAKTSIIITKDYAIPENSVLPYLRGTESIGITEDPYGGNTIWPCIGSDNVSYLGFGAIDPRISYSSNLSKPVFFLNLTLNVARNIAYLTKVSPDDYSILIKLYKNDPLNESNKVFEVKRILDTTALNSMGKSEILRGESANYVVEIPIESSYTSGQYYAKLYTIKNTLPFENKKIATTTTPTPPYFKPGELQYATDRIFHFGLNYKQDRKIIVLFNTDFSSPHNITLDKENLPADFSIKIIDNGIEKTLPATINLGNFERRNITLVVDANKPDPWYDTNFLAYFNLIASTNQLGVTPTNIQYTLNISKDTLCLYNDIVIQDCSPTNPYKTIKHNLNPSSSPSCPSKPNTIVPCEGAFLPFSSFFSIIIAITLILFYYNKRRI